MFRASKRRSRGVGAIVAAITAFLSAGASPAAAQTCTPDQFAAAVDDAGAALREVMRTNQPRLETRIKALQAKYGWDASEAEDKALELLNDARTSDFDRSANDLLAKIDTLGNLTPRETPDCSRLQALQAASLELQATVKAKSTYLLTRADALIAGTPPPAQASVPIAPPAKAASGQTAAVPPQAPAAPAATPAAPPANRPAPSTSWSTTTSVETKLPVPDAGASAPASAAPPMREEDQYTIDEIVRASSGFFGRVSAGLGSIVEHAFGKIGRPTGYILGEEGGGAFMAGLRYGRGTLYLRDGRTMPIHWHGPSIGWDVGAQGAKVMFLAYGVRDPEQLMLPFTSLEGSAFIAGGLGLTLMTNGGAQLAPIRSGLGLRVGASIGYVRFTRRPTWNPF